jgi:hypothetical protein
MNPALTPPLKPFFISKTVINLCKPTNCKKNKKTLIKKNTHPKPLSTFANPPTLKMKKNSQKKTLIQNRYQLLQTHPL